MRMISARSFVLQHRTFFCSVLLIWNWVAWQNQLKSSCMPVWVWDKSLILWFPHQMSYQDVLTLTIPYSFLLPLVSLDNAKELSSRICLYFWKPAEKEVEGSSAFLTQATHLNRSSYTAYEMGMQLQQLGQLFCSHSLPSSTQLGIFGLRYAALTIDFWMFRSYRLCGKYLPPQKDVLAHRTWDSFWHHRVNFKYLGSQGNIKNLRFVHEN